MVCREDRGGVPARIVQEARMQLENGFSASQIARSISSKRLQLTILPTEKCNFRCTYCYEDFAIGRMKRPVIDGIKRLVDARARELGELSLSWFGGEPLLALQVILEISAYCRELSAECGFAFEGGLTTNGYLLTPDVLQSLVENYQNFFQISLDGWGEVHDSTRRRADGRGTFDRIWNNLLLARDSALDFEILLRVHVTDSNYPSLMELCRRIHVEFASDRRFRLDFQDVRDLGGDGGEGVVPVGPDQFKAMVATLRALAAGKDEVPATSELAVAAPVAKGESAGGRRAYEIDKGEPYICYAAKPNHFLIRADGRVGKCTVALNSESNSIGTIGPDGTIRINQKLAQAWSMGFASMDIDQMGCPLPFVIKSLRDEAPEKRIPLAMEA
jgi:uncharacterized protein